MKRLTFLWLFAVIPFLIKGQAHPNLERSFQFRNYAVNAVQVEPRSDSLFTEDGAFVIDEAKVSIEVLDTNESTNWEPQANNINTTNNLNYSPNSLNQVNNEFSGPAIALNNFSNQPDNFNGNLNNNLFLNNGNNGLFRPGNSVFRPGMNVQTRVYPNPTTNRIALEISMEEKAEISIWLLDASGKRLREIVPKGKFQPGVHTFQSNVSELAAGMYYLQVTGLTAVTKPFVRK